MLPYLRKQVQPSFLLLKFGRVIVWPNDLAIKTYSEWEFFTVAVINKNPRG